MPTQFARSSTTLIALALLVQAPQLPNGNQPQRTRPEGTSDYGLRYDPQSSMNAVSEWHLEAMGWGSQASDGYDAESGSHFETRPLQTVGNSWTHSTMRAASSSFDCPDSGDCDCLGSGNVNAIHTEDFHFLADSNRLEFGIHSQTWIDMFLQVECYGSFTGFAYGNVVFGHTRPIFAQGQMFAMPQWTVPFHVDRSGVMNIVEAQLYQNASPNQVNLSEGHWRIWRRVNDNYILVVEDHYLISFGSGVVHSQLPVNPFPIEPGDYLFEIDYGRKLSHLSEQQGAGSNSIQVETDSYFSVKLRYQPN